jgi:hypothetical protein
VAYGDSIVSMQLLLASRTTVNGMNRPADFGPAASVIAKIASTARRPRRRPRPRPFRVPERADGRHHDQAAVLAPGDEILPRGQRERHHFNPGPDQQVDPLLEVRLVGAHVDAKRLVSVVRTVATASANSAYDIHAAA